MFEKKLSLLKRNGFVVIKNVLSQRLCQNYIKKLEKILKDRAKNKRYVGSKNTIVLYNYFIEDNSLLKLLVLPVIDKFMTKLIDEDYVLISAAARNKMIFDLKNKKFKSSKASGNKWHTDNRYLNGKALKPSINYFAIIALEDFTKNNGGTKYIPKSHLNSKKVINKKEKFSNMEAKRGSVIIMDSNLLHQAGEPSFLSRWSIFNLYSPWFVKPYFQFNKLVKEKYLSKNIKKVLHFNSLPPTDYNKSLTTLIKL